jgi:hypothetical protein
MNRNISSKQQEIISAVDISGWNMSNERALAESLFEGRLNFFLVLFSIFMTAGFANSFSNRSIVFFLGSLVLFVVWLPLRRICIKYDAILRIIGEKENHPFLQTNKFLSQEGYSPIIKISKLMGIYIPLLCILILFLLGVAVDTAFLY